MSFKTIICDLDGTIADCSDRIGYVRSKPPNWKAFFAGIANDKVHWDVWSVIDLAATSAQIIFVTGRPEEHRNVTQNWIRQNGLWQNNGLLLMRPSGDHRQDYIVKEEIFRKHIEPHFDGPYIAFDDRQQVVDMWRRIGIRCFQVAEGNF